MGPFSPPSWLNYDPNWLLFARQRLSQLQTAGQPLPPADWSKVTAPGIPGPGVITPGPSYRPRMPVIVPDNEFVRKPPTPGDPSGKSKPPRPVSFETLQWRDYSPTTGMRFTPDLGLWYNESTRQWWDPVSMRYVEDPFAKKKKEQEQQPVPFSRPPDWEPGGGR